MKEIKHLDLCVDSDMQRAAKFDGTLADYAAKVLNERLQEQPDFCSVINIESTTGSSEMRPKLNNSATWYTKRWIQLSVWYYGEY